MAVVPRRGRSPDAALAALPLTIATVTSPFHSLPLAFVDLYLSDLDRRSCHPGTMIHSPSHPCTIWWSWWALPAR